ncbi:uncharacterized protein LOC122640927 isoform X1 [Telopea speciosissima]|uniref:uncharacterized protein LOC122640927 isoform X1 n=1 Tax=Telopea speciosissima TaxID=54955 RepID=UPI001CC69731|nr:uncharacterized protein LOC122640927 isoform X1 [Telopea speciosissima]XP_043690151.1 uncharacterized protein LOC122640927 isoform X1 [Telopea speciosissima]XP_043690153.1 uncharacterized protein LOC122640927 isoform X1 [Telopea speciosissima]XP_043690154.1 uncharacterized protein LOC122640927 isoform X1 [Telopea speciosissima]
MSGGEVRRVSRQDIQLVQNLIERCLQLYMTQKEVVETLLVQAKIEPDFTELVWQKLEEENKEFFKAYQVRLLVKQQINAFNELLEKQAELMRKICPAGVAPMPNSIGSNTTPLPQTPACYVSERTITPSRMENMHYPISPNTSSTIINDGPLVSHTMHTAGDVSAHTRRTDVSSNTLSTQNSHMGMAQGMNGVVIKQEAGYSNNSAFTVGSNGNVLDMRPTIADSSVALLNGVDSNSQQLNDPVDAETSAFGFLGQIPRNFSLSDLTADFNQSSDILESYSRSPFLVTNPEDFLESPGRGECLGEDKRLDTISEGLSYDEFASD